MENFINVKSVPATTIPANGTAVFQTSVGKVDSVSVTTTCGQTVAFTISGAPVGLIGSDQIDVNGQHTTNYSASGDFKGNKLIINNVSRDTAASITVVITTF